MEEYVQLIVRCVDPSSERRPVMNYVVTELDRILEKEMNLTTVMGEGTPVVTLGSQLFRAIKWNRMGVYGGYFFELWSLFDEHQSPNI